MTLTIYGDRISGNCLKVKWVADRLGVADRGIREGILRSLMATGSLGEARRAGVRARPQP